MIYSPRFIAILDACVLYPAPLRDYLLNLANLDLFKPRWTDRIQEEWTRNLLINRPDLNWEKLEKTKSAMNLAFPDSNIENYEPLIESLKLPDPDDCHVLAAGIKVNADIIVTFNLKDFPQSELRKFDIEVQHPDEFICHLIDLNEQEALKAFNNQVARLRNPPILASEVFEILARCGLTKTVTMLRKKHS